MKHMILTAAAVAAAVVGTNPPAAAAAEHAVTVRAAKPKSVAESDGYVYVGRVVSSHSVKITARVTGSIVEQNGKEGDSVKKDDVLFRIEDTIYKANLQTAKAQLAELEARCRHAEKELDRYAASEKRGGVSKIELDRVTLNRDVLKAQIEAAKAKVILCEDDLAHCTVASPIDGVIGTTEFKAGNNVSPVSGVLTDVLAINPIDVEVAFPEPTVIWAFENRQLRMSTKIRLLRSDGAEYPVKLELFAIDNKVDPATGTVKLRLRGDNSQGVLRPGGYVKLVISEKFSEPKLSVPMSAVVFEGDARFVYVVENGKAVKRKIELGDQTGDDTFVEKGVTAGDTVVTDGVHKVFDGAPLKVN
ncbi:MAG: efflux RND transporter periplasmic adaptor subunit [Kiritimatiellae bacterium]|nr:efflux RND transporter periplasmic adaptor subunit [Kiritimatiellia bacterium]